MSKVLDGKAAAQAIYADISARIERLRSEGRAVSIALVRVGRRPEDLVYEGMIAKRSSKLGINVELYAYEDGATENDLAQAIEEINNSESIDACMIFRPLPEDIDEMRICNMLDAGKDIDGIGAKSLAGVFMGLDEGFAPATADACMRLLDFYGIGCAGKRVAVIGRSLVIGKPVAMLALTRDATVTLAHSRTEDVVAITKDSDIVICATGKARMFDADYFCAGQVVLDVGMNACEDGSLCGDADFDGAVAKGVDITPVPGGIGAVTTAVLLEHAIDAAERR